MTATIWATTSHDQKWGPGSRRSNAAPPAQTQPTMKTPNTTNPATVWTLAMAGESTGRPSGAGARRTAWIGSTRRCPDPPRPPASSMPCSTGSTRSSVGPWRRCVGPSPSSRAPGRARPPPSRADRLPGPHGHVPRRGDPRRHVHGEGRGRAPGAARGARRGGRGGADVPRCGAVPAQPSLRATPGHPLPQSWTRRPPCSPRSPTRSRPRTGSCPAPSSPARSSGRRTASPHRPATCRSSTPSSTPRRSPSS